MARAAALILSALALGACSQERTMPATAQPRITVRGNPVTLEGSPPAVGDKAPDFAAVATDMSEKRLSDFRGKTVILSSVGSIDTATCDVETRTFNERAAALGPNTVILTISMDLPFAQKRWCAAHGIDRVITLSDYKHREFGSRYGLRVRESGLLARAIFVVNPQGAITYQQIVADIAQEPDYDPVIAAAKSAAR
jgi:thiol peroxidase